MLMARPPPSPSGWAKPPAAPSSSPRRPAASRREIADGLDDPEALIRRLQEECSLVENGARQMVDYVRATRDGLGVVPSDTDVVFERSSSTTPAACSSLFTRPSARA